MSEVETFTYKAEDVSTVTHDQLSRTLTAGTDQRSVVLIDVREDDFAEGNIVGALHYPFDTFRKTCSDLVAKLKPTQKVVFYCQKGLARSPNAAVVYIRRRKLSLGKQSVPPPPTWADFDQNSARNGNDRVLRQEVYVLTGGFEQWKAQ
jgi:rhodanese-related sulfurtransferase